MNAALLTVIAIATSYLLVKIASISISLLRYWKAAPKQDGEDSTAARGTGSFGL